ncbi:MAG TPA: NAD(P)H-hydrate dehydratase, partial [Arenibaculum sp.]|nr:NAD(P)H-hydrate dehydratase [Arenibaculum sp.]
RLCLLGDPSRLSGDAARAAALWRGPIEPAGPAMLDGAAVAVDALFGAGLSRPLDGIARDLVETLAASGLPVVAVDVPSGMHGDSGEVSGAAVRATVTVTFFRPKPGHLLLPGRLHLGTLEVADIGIPDDALDQLRPAIAANHPDLWAGRFPWPQPAGHKYDRGNCVVWSGARMTGAARLAARAARRTGAGLATIACPPSAAAIHAAGDPGVIVEPVEGPRAFARLIADPRRNAVLLGPGAGISPATRQLAAAALEAGKAVVLDADALTAFARDPGALFARLSGSCVLTPHEGEFARLFGRCLSGGGAGEPASTPEPAGKVGRAIFAARTSGAVVLLKGADTVVAAPDGRATINANAPPDLATAGAGDVLAGLVAGLLAQGMDAFDAACAGTWLHGEAAAAVGPGLIAEDLTDALPGVLRRLRPATD